LVKGTPLSVAEIAARVGYDDASAMTRMFRRAFGLSPRQLRGSHPQ
jgi:transcriptional regulator GlxA family with amidase domain